MWQNWKRQWQNKRRCHSLAWYPVTFSRLSRQIQVRRYNGNFEYLSFPWKRKRRIFKSAKFRRTSHSILRWKRKFCSHFPTILSDFDKRDWYNKRLKNILKVSVWETSTILLLLFSLSFMHYCFNSFYDKTLLSSSLFSSVENCSSLVFFFPFTWLSLQPHDITQM